MLANIARGNATKSKTYVRVEPVFGAQKSKMGLFIQTIGIKRVAAKITRANFAYNEKKKHDDEVCGEIEPAPPGYLGSQDMFYMGNRKGVG
jgi:hypothetical protein